MFDIEDKIIMRNVLDDLYVNFSETENILSHKIDLMKKEITKINKKILNNFGN